MIPNLFTKKELPQKLPDRMQKIVNELKKVDNKEEVLQKAY